MLKMKPTVEIHPIIMSKTENPSVERECKDTGYQQEIWKSVENFEGIYEVSNTGKVRSLDRKGWNNNLKGKILIPSSNKGYLRIRLCKNGRGPFKLIHRLVAQTFIPNPRGLPEVNRKNLDKGDNHINNLEWVSKQENMEHARINGAILSGEKTFKSKLTRNEVCLIREEYLSNTYASCLNLAKKYKVSKGVIRTIILNKSWVDNEYQDIVDSNQFKDRLDKATTKGELNRSAKLKEYQVIEIRQRYRNGDWPVDLAYEYGVSRGHIKMIVKRKTWKHI